MARAPHRRHIEKSLVHALYERGQVIMNWGTGIVGSLGLGTFVSWVLSNLLQRSGTLLSADKFLWQGLVILYFTSWVAGVQNDKSIQEKIYIGAPEKLRIGAVALVWSFFIYGLFAVMFADVAYALINKDASPRFPLNLLVGIKPVQFVFAFIVFLNLFWALNVIIWRYYVNSYIKPVEHRSEVLYRDERDYVGLLKVQIIRNYIKGKWQWHRYAVGGVLLLGCDAVLWIWRDRSDVILAVVLSLCAFLMVVETWIWSMRFRVSYSVASVDEIARHYQLIPHRQRTLAAGRRPGGPRTGPLGRFAGDKLSDPNPPPQPLSPFGNSVGAS